MWSSVDNSTLTIKAPKGKVASFERNRLPTRNADTYHVPVSGSFPCIDAITNEAVIQYTIASTHDIKGVKALRDIHDIYKDLPAIPFVFFVPEKVATGGFAKQKITTVKGAVPAPDLPPVKQYVIGVPIGINMTELKNKLRHPRSTPARSAKHRKTSL